MATIYYDCFGSIERRRLQEERDATELARPVRSVFSAGAEGAYLALRSVEERVAASTPSPKTVGERLLRRARKELKKGRINKAQVRRHKRLLSSGGIFAEPAEPTS